MCSSRIINNYGFVGLISSSTCKLTSPSKTPKSKEKQCLPTKTTGRVSPTPNNLSRCTYQPHSPSESESTRLTPGDNGNSEEERVFVNKMQRSAASYAINDLLQEQVGNDNLNKFLVIIFGIINSSHTHLLDF